MRHVDILGCVEAVEVHELDPCSEVDVEFCICDAVGGGDAVAMGSELIGVAEQAVKGRVFGERGVKVVGVVDGRALVIGKAVGYKQVGVFADRFGVVEGRTDRPGVQRIEVMLVDVLKGIELVEGVAGIVISVTIISIGGAGQVEGQGSVLLPEPVAERKVGAVDIKAGVHAG